MFGRQRQTHDPLHRDTELQGGSSDRGTCEERDERSERGVVVIWFALMLIVLLGIAGFAVDLSNWWVQSQRLQKAADAGAQDRKSVV